MERWERKAERRMTPVAAGGRWGLGGGGESGEGKEKEYDAWGPHLVVDMEFENRG
jgi:hypothetical protein